MKQAWQFDVFAELDGVLAILPFGEIKQEVRKHPKAVSYDNYDIFLVVQHYGSCIKQCIRDVVL